MAPAHPDIISYDRYQANQTVDGLCYQDEEEDDQTQQGEHVRFVGSSDAFTVPIVQCVQRGLFAYHRSFRNHAWLRLTYSFDARITDDMQTHPYCSVSLLLLMRDELPHHVWAACH